jgi:hypothetical protein
VIAISSVSCYLSSKSLAAHPGYTRFRLVRWDGLVVGFDGALRYAEAVAGFQIFLQCYARTAELVVCAGECALIDAGLRERAG